MTYISRQQLASYGGLPQEAAEACQRALANRPDNWGQLSCNPQLAPDVWHLLWGQKRLQADQAKRLVSRRLDRAQRDKVTSSERRTGVLTALIEHNVLDRDEQEKLSAKAALGPVLLRQPWLAEDLRADTALRAGGISLLAELALQPEHRFSTAQRLEIIRTYRSWICEKDFSRRARYLRIVFGRWPELGDDVLAWNDGPDEMLTALAGNANLTPEQARLLVGLVDGEVTLTEAQMDVRHYCLLALAANPRCPQDVVAALTHIRSSDSFRDRKVIEGARRREDHPVLEGAIRGVENPVLLSWILRRSLPRRTEYAVQQDRPLELLELSGNPHLDEQQRHDVDTAIDLHVEEVLCHALGGATAHTALDNECHESLALPSYYEEAMQLAAERLGSDLVRWEMLVGLIDDFEGTFHELVAIAEAI